MKTITWKPNTNKELDNEFEYLRNIQHNDISHKLWKNYDRETLAQASAFTICYNDEGIPEMCSSIAIKNCWPKETYRILNRLWKSSNRINYPKIMSPSFAETALSQINWLKENTECRLIFISRQSNNWEDWVINQFKSVYNIQFCKNEFKYLTCSNESDDSCWQKIIYQGDKSILEEWKRCL
jgi:hypothetical protein